MKINFTRALASLFFTSFVIIQLQASEPACVVEPGVVTSQKLDRVSKMHVDQLAMLKSLDFGARQIVDAVNGIESIKFTPPVQWVQYVPVCGPYGLDYVPNAQVAQDDPVICDRICQYKQVVIDNFYNMTQEVRKERAFLIHGDHAIALFEGAHDALNKALLDENDESVAQAAQDYISLIDLQKNYVEQQQKKITKEYAQLIIPGIVQTIIQKAQLQSQAKQEAAAKLVRKEVKKSRQSAQKLQEKESLAQAKENQEVEAKHALEAANNAMQERAKEEELLAQATQEAAAKLARKEAKKARHLAQRKENESLQENKIEQENKAHMIDQSIKSEESKFQDIKGIKKQAESQRLKNKKDTEIKSLELFMTRADALINAGGSLATVEQRLNYAQNESIAVFLDDVERAQLHVNTIEPMQQHFNKFKNTKKHDAAYKAVHAKLDAASQELIGALGYLAREKWNLLTGNTEDLDKKQ
ncbi:MAG: hypothetical protein P4L31_06740 [Candidatus Babeliales bacterium]|nr:hypothetical protein [Candidatus Babeliales bacterium]